MADSIEIAKESLKQVFPPRLHSYPPSATGSAITIPTTILCRCKTWETNLCVNSKRKLLNKNRKAFVDTNGLKAGDALFWEVLDSSNEKVEFRVQIVKGDFPAELEAKVIGKTKDNPIIIDWSLQSKE